MKNLILFLFLFSTTVFAQNSKIFRIDSLPADGVVLDKGWKFKTGDKPDFAKANFDDSDWVSIDPTKDVKKLPEILNAQTKWLRLDFEITKPLLNPLGITVNQVGASEIYLNGRLVHTFGHFDTDSAKVVAYDPLEYVIPFPANSVGHYTLAVRYALQPSIGYTNIFALTKNRLFNATILALKPTLNTQRNFMAYKVGLDVFIFGVVFILFVLNLFFYLYQRSNKTHFFLAVYLFGSSISRLFKIIGQNQHSVEYRYFSLNIANWALGVAIVALANVIYRMAKLRLDFYFYTLLIFQFAYSVISNFTSDSLLQTRLLLIGNLFSFFLVMRVVRLGIKKGIKGFLILSLAIFISIFGLAFISVSILFLNYGISPNGYKTLTYGISPYLVDTVFTVSSIALPIGLSLFMGIDSSETNKTLNKKLIENETLKNKAIEHQQEKQHLLETQNETLEKQVAERTAALKESLETLKATQNQLIQSEKLASLGELTAGIAHEIQNPLNFVNNFSELSVELAQELQEALRHRGIEATSEEAEIVADLIQNQEKINQHGKRASNIVKGMLDHSRKNTGVRELTDINKLADEYLRLSYHGLRAKDKPFNADFRTDFDEQLPKINIIPQEIGRVLLNLFNNAFYAVNEKKAKNIEKDYQPVVSVSTKQSNNRIIIKVKDNGTGIPESVKSKIFQPFFTTKPTGSGTGLGLSISYDIITKGHGGKFGIETKEGAFTEFIIELKKN